MSSRAGGGPDKSTSTASTDELVGCETDLSKKKRPGRPRKKCDICLMDLSSDPDTIGCGTCTRRYHTRCAVDDSESIPPAWACNTCKAIQIVKKYDASETLNNTAPDNDSTHTVSQYISDARQYSDNNVSDTNLSDPEVCGACHKKQGNRSARWVSCGNCEKWYHISCVGVNVRQYNDIETSDGSVEWLCKACKRQGRMDIKKFDWGEHRKCM